MRLNKKTKVLGLGALAACGVCCAPLIVPLAVMLGGIGVVWGGFLALGFGVLAVAVYLAWQRHRKNCECC